MKSDIFQVQEKLNREPVLVQVERLAELAGTEKKDALTLRLLAEEMLGMVEHLLPFCSGGFWMDSKDRSFELHLKVEAIVTQEKKEELLSVSAGKNAATKGILGKISGVFESMLFEKHSIDTEMGYMPPDQYVMLGGEYSHAWSLVNYKEQAEPTVQQEDWDGLERSILANYADDIVIGVHANRVEMVVKKKFA